MAAVIPAFSGETRFAMLAYSILYRWTPERRELDYLRMLGASNQSAKEVKIFGLGRYLADRSRVLFDRFYRENKALAIKRAVSRVAVESASDGRILRRLHSDPDAHARGRADGRGLTFLVGAFARSRGLIESLFSSLNNIAEQALYIKDLFDFFETKPQHRVGAGCDSRAAADPIGLRISRRVVRLFRDRSASRFERT